MPYKKSYRKKRKSTFSKKQKSEIKKIAEKSGELKTKQMNDTDTSLIASSGFTGPNIQDLAIAQGLDDDERIGDMVQIQKVQWRLSINTGTASGLVRVFAIQNLDDVDPTGINHQSPSPIGFFPSLQTSIHRYQKLYDRTYSLDPSYKSNLLLNINVPGSKLRIKKVQFDDASTNVVSGNVRIFVSTDNTDASQMTANCQMKVYWYDN